MPVQDLETLFSQLSRHPDVDAENLQAYDATDRLLLDEVRHRAGAEPNIAVIGDRYGALTLGALAVTAVEHVRVHQDLYTGRLALARNAAAAGLDGRYRAHDLGPGLLQDAGLVVLQLPKSLAELEEIADAVARFAAPGAILLAGGRVKHMSLGMNDVLQKYFGSVQPQLARQKSRTLVARDARHVPVEPPFPVLEDIAELGIKVAARGAVFSGARLDIGTRFLLGFLDRMPEVPRAVDLGCGTGILATMYAKLHPGAAVLATDQSAAAVASAKGTAEANGLADRISVLHDDAMSTLPGDSAELILLNPPFHVGATVHAGAALKMFQAAARVLAAGGELWTVYNSHLQYKAALERLVGPTEIEGRNPKFTVARTRRAART
ncbi:class I SAM-dependent methyltransferase [Paenarthrobacter sp. NCHU4564]|uniref:class I SAM-dependent methyltransferase n=1 Tax=Paenarthrobacter sp. NCHU4564 TaxID=3451353 RepID=UPI003F99CE78